MTASRFAHTQVLSIRDNVGDKTVTYHGNGYTYHLHKTAKDIWAKLQIARKTMKAFLQQIGIGEDAKHSIYGLSEVCVCDQGVGGWFEVFVIDERKLWAVVNFLKKLNRWMLGANVRPQKDTRHHYFIEARKFQHTPPKHLRSAPYHEIKKPERVPNNVIPFAPSPVYQPKMVPTARLEHLASTVNARFGH